MKNKKEDKITNQTSNKTNARRNAKSILPMKDSARNPIGGFQTAGSSFLQASEMKW